MYTHIIAFVEPKMFLVCALILLVGVLSLYISLGQRDLLYHLPEFHAIGIEKKTILYVVTDQTKPFSKNNPTIIKKWFRRIHKTGSRVATKEETDTALKKDPTVRDRFTAIVFSVNDKPVVLSLREADKERVGFAVIKRPKI